MQPGIREQLQLEDRMVRKGIERYEQGMKSAEKQDRGAETEYARRLIKEYLGTIAAGIQEFLDDKGPGKQGKVRPLLRHIHVEQAAYFALRGVFNSFTRQQPVQTVAINIGRMIEDEVRFTRFRTKHKDYYDKIIADFARKGTKSYRHMHRVLTFKANEKSDGWNPWADDERLLVGTKLVDILRLRTELVEVKHSAARKNGRRPGVVLHPTDKAKEWINRFVRFAEMLDPDRMPCIIAPDDWSDISNGGYYSPQLRSSTPLVLNARAKHRDLLQTADLSKVLKATNLIQSTAWQVNTRILEVMQEVWDKNLGIGMPDSSPYVIPPCPLKEGESSKALSEAREAEFTDWKRAAAIIHTKEKERVSKCFQVARAIRMAQEYKGYGKIWFAYQLDFRTRTYAAASGMSPQGTDSAKALVHFAEGKRLGARGMFWLKVHLANVYGFDKAAYNDRAAWADERRDQLLALADNPLDHRSFWGDADKPWQFLAAAFEFADATRRGTAIHSRLPIALDGSCNGLQHFSAMLRDPVGGRATNLIPSDTQSDIYGEVARVCTERLRNSSDPMAREWLAFCRSYGDGVLPRGIAKRPVMTLPYGATKRACTDHIFSCIYDTHKGYFKGGDFKAAHFLTELLWDSISSVVVSARVAMAYIQECAGILSRKGLPLVWTTPLGFPVYQATMDIAVRQVETQLCGRLRLRIAQETKKLDLSKQKQGAAPNFVHSMDATHMHMTVLAGAKAGITSWAMIHDDYGTHAADVDTLHTCIRESFVSLYTKNDPLRALYETNPELLPPPPPKGDLDIKQVLQSQFFFG